MRHCRRRHRIRRILTHLHLTMSDPINPRSDERVLTLRIRTIGRAAGTLRRTDRPRTASTTTVSSTVARRRADQILQAVLRRPADLSHRRDILRNKSRDRIRRCRRTCSRPQHRYQSPLLCRRLHRRCHVRRQQYLRGRRRRSLFHGRASRDRQVRPALRRVLRLAARHSSRRAPARRR